MISERERRIWGDNHSPERQDAWESLLLDIDAAISLTATQYEGLKARYEAVAAVLQNPHDPELGDLLVFPQGSFRTRTVTKPPDRDDVDIDAIAYVLGGTDLVPMELLDRLFTELKTRVRTGGTVSLAKRCVTIQYEDKKLPCHMDVTPAERKPGNSKDDGSGRLRVPDRSTESWSPSNPKDYAEWFDEMASIELKVRLTESYRQLISKRADTEPLPSHEEITAPNGLRIGVRLMKRHRDVYVKRTGRKETQPISILITTLAAKAYERVAVRSHDKVMTPLQILTEVTAEMLNCFDPPQQGEQYRLENPEDTDENFAEKWNDNPELPRTFFDWHQNLERSLHYGYIDFPSRERFRSELTEAFGTSSGHACDEYFAVIKNVHYPGLSPAAAEQARIAGQSAALIGLGRTEPTRAAQPKPLDRLG